jgi:hypothetical protein
MLFFSRLNQRNQGPGSTPTGRKRSAAARSRLALERLEDRTVPSGSALGFQADGVGANDSTGSSVSAGDVNGDGIADLIIGASGANSGAGKVYVVFGTRGGFADPLPLSSLDGTNGFELDGLSGDQAGFSVSAGDVNGDGVADILIGAGTANSGAGKVDVVFGKATGWSGTPTALNAAFVNGINGAEFDGPSIYSSLGNGPSTLAVGDVNGDGIGDLLMDAPHVASNTGAFYVVFGKRGAWSSTATTLNSTFLDGTNGAEFDGPAQAFAGGSSVAVGDVNGDGFADLLIGAPNANFQARTFPATSTGAVDVVFGKSGGWSGTATTLNSAFLNGVKGIEFDGPRSSNTGVSVAAGDVTGDHIADLVIGASIANAGTGSVYVVFGASHLLPQTTVSTTRKSSTATVASVAGLAVGETVSSANLPAGTTITAISGSTITLSNKATATGSAALYVSKVTLDASFLNGTNGVEFDGRPNGSSGSYTGASVAVGDVNGDGIGDLVIGAYGANADHSGAVYVVFGKSGPWSGTATTLDSTFLNGSNGVELDGGNVCVAVGDLNGDGIADILIGAPGTTINGVTTGAVYVVFGKTSGWTSPVSLDGL